MEGACTPTTASGTPFSSAFEIPSLEDAHKTLCDPSTDIVLKMRSIFVLRHHGGPAAIKALEDGLKHDSALLRHEIAYVMGQLEDDSALPILERLLADKDEHPIVRHEAGEALAAIGNPSSICIIEKYASDPDVSIKETCELALRSLLKKKKELEEVSEKEAAAGAGLDDQKRFYLFGSAGCENVNFKTIDPAKADKSLALQSTNALREILLDERTPLWDRYEVLFALRDRDDDEAATAIIESLNADRTSALFRHEVAFVIGQMQRRAESAAEELMKCLTNTKEHAMARHEAVLALGSAVCSFGASNKPLMRKCISLLERYRADPEAIVAESCVCALDNVKSELGAEAYGSIVSA